MLHATVSADLVAADAQVARQLHGHRVNSFELSGPLVTLRFDHHRMRLDGTYYDAEPFRLAFVDTGGSPLPGEAWPSGLHNGEHPTLKVPWACVQGTYEYHVFAGHAGDIWDKYRAQLRLAQLVDHLLRRCGR
jgi:hypothetical protein